MEFTNLLFYLFAFLALLFGVLVVANPFSRNPVTSAMFLVLTMICISGLFVLLHAWFLAAVQIRVYAGAVMVLFLFVIMLLNLQEEERRKLNLFGTVTGLASVGGLLAILWSALSSGSLPAAAASGAEGSTRALGSLLFTQGQFLLPFEVLSLLLLVAMMGAILLSKKELK